MPWRPEQATKFSKGLSGDSKRKWASIANAILARTGDEAFAIRAANSRTKPSPEAIRRRLNGR